MPWGGGALEQSVPVQAPGHGELPGCRGELNINVHENIMWGGAGARWGRVMVCVVCVEAVKSDGAPPPAPPGSSELNQEVLSRELCSVLGSETFVLFAGEPGVQRRQPRAVGLGESCVPVRRAHRLMTPHPDL